jgi:hypothetical protein
MVRRQILRRFALTPTVIKRVQSVENNGEHNSNRQDHDNGQLGRDVLRRVLVAEGFGADLGWCTLVWMIQKVRCRETHDVADAEGHENDGVHGDLLGVSRI